MSNVLSLFIRTVESTVLRVQALDTKLAIFIKARAEENKIFTFEVEMEWFLQPMGTITSRAVHSCPSHYSPRTGMITSYNQIKKKQYIPTIFCSFLARSSSLPQFKQNNCIVPAFKYFLVKWSW